MKIDGFLSPNIFISLKKSKDFYGKLPDEVELDLELECLSYDINKLAMKVAQVSFPLNSLSDFLAGVLYARLVQDYQAVILMASRGMRAQSRTMARSALETMFHCLAASEDIQLKSGRASPISYVDAVLSANDSYRLRQSLQVLQSEFLSADVKADVVRAMEGVKETKPTGINLQNLAEDLQRSGWYSRYYRRLSQDSHPSITAIEHHIFISDPNEPANAQFGPSYVQFQDTVVVAIFVLFEALRSLLERQLPQEMGSPIEEEMLVLLKKFAPFVTDKDISEV